MLLSRKEFTRKTLLAAAGLTLSPELLLGQTSYTVQKGDTLSHIARRYGVTVADLRNANGIRGDLIRVGQTLSIPNKNSSSPNFLAKVKAETNKIRVKRDTWKLIVAHHSAIKYGNATVYDRSHRERGMQNGLAYHFVIGNGINSGDGEIEVGPRWRKQLHGGHVRNHKVNMTGIGICMIGNFEQTKPSAKQMMAFVQLVDWLQKDVLRKKVRFAGHKDIEQNLCPGKHFPLAAMHRRYD